MCGSVLQCITACCNASTNKHTSVLQFIVALEFIVVLKFRLVLKFTPVVGCIHLTTGVNLRTSLILRTSTFKFIRVLEYTPTYLKSKGFLDFCRLLLARSTRGCPMCEFVYCNGAPPGAGVAVCCGELS